MPEPLDSPISVAALDPARARTLFASPARVAGADFLMREVSARMQERLNLLKLQPQTVLDAGCGAGADVIALRQRYPGARLIGLDASPALLAAAQARFGRSGMPSWLERWLGKQQPQWQAADLAETALPGQIVDLLWSNLALHWHPQPSRVLAEWWRLLRDEGALLFSCWGPDTFIELRRAFAEVDAYPHTLTFVDMHDWGDRMVQAGFAGAVMDRETLTLTYADPDDLLAEVRQMGGNPLRDRRRGLLSRRQGARLRQALEDLRQSDGRIPLTVEVLYGHAFKLANTPKPADETVIRWAPRR